MCVIRAMVLSIALLVGSSSVFAQFLPNNSDLSEESLVRWMNSNHAMALLMDTIDQQLPSDEAYLAFEALAAPEQDKIIADILAERELSEQAQRVVRQHGWKSVGEYRRYGNKLGNAIAAYFVWQDTRSMPPEQEEAYRKTLDQVVLDVSQADIQFIAANEKALSRYIQSYASGL